MTTAAFENAVTVAMSIGGSTNAIIHLIAMAGRAGVPLRSRPTSTRSRGARRCSPTSGPSGKYLMEDFFYAGGLRGAAGAAAATCWISTR